MYRGATDASTTGNISGGGVNVQNNESRAVINISFVISTSVPWVPDKRVLDVLGTRYSRLDPCGVT